jgi:hypothetical protein
MRRARKKRNLFLGVSVNNRDTTKGEYAKSLRGLDMSPFPGDDRVVIDVSVPRHLLCPRAFPEGLVVQEGGGFGGIGVELDVVGYTD